MAAKPLIFPSEINVAQTVCALRFQGYEYEEAITSSRTEGVGAQLQALAQPVIGRLVLHARESDNFAAFFYLQRFLFKWGGAQLDKLAAEHMAFDFLFLHLYRSDPPPEFQEDKYMTQWRRDFAPRAEEIAAYLRKSFARRRRVPTLRP